MLDLDLGVRTLNARSLILSVLLGSPRPRLAPTAPAVLAELFGIAPGTMRTAISRMLAAGELVVVDNRYELRGPLIERKAAQDIGRRRARSAWDATWWIVTVTTASRELAARRDFRTAMANARLGELRPDTWMRPANLAGPRLAPGTIIVRGTVDGEDEATLAGRLWDLPAMARRSEQLLAALDAGFVELRSGGTAALASTTPIAAATVRFLRTEPLLPPALTPADWPVEALRDRYRDFDRTYGRVLRDALADQEPLP